MTTGDLSALKRTSQRKLLQRLFWNRCGFALLRKYIGLRQRIDYVLLNYSIDSDTNGEYWLIEQLNQEPTVMDIGFYSGDYTAAVLERRPRASVRAFDPSKFAAGQHSGRFGDDRRVVFERMGVSDKSGTAVFHDYGNMNNSLVTRPNQDTSGAEYAVPIVTLDEYCAQQGIKHVDLLKIDAEGFDANVLEGAGRMLESESIDIFMFEYADGWIANRRFYSDIQSLLEKMPYRLCRLFNGFLVPMDRAHDWPPSGCGFMSVGVSQKRLRERPIKIVNAGL
jgi:FkbM family methyltransferase